MDILIPDVTVAEKILGSVIVADLRAALRKEGIAAMSEVRYAILEEDGHVSVIARRSLPA